MRAGGGARDGRMTLAEEFEFHYGVFKDGLRVGSVAAEWHGRAEWSIDHPDFRDPGEPRTIVRVDDVLYAAGFEIMADD